MQPVPIFSLFLARERVGVRVGSVQQVLFPLTLALAPTEGEGTFVGGVRNSRPVVF